MAYENYTTFLYTEQAEPQKNARDFNLFFDKERDRQLYIEFCLSLSFTSYKLLLYSFLLISEVSDIP